LYVSWPQCQGRYVLIDRLPCAGCFTLFPYTTLFRSGRKQREKYRGLSALRVLYHVLKCCLKAIIYIRSLEWCIYGCLCLRSDTRSEEHTSELQSRFDLVCRLLLEKKKQISRFLVTEL